MAPSSGSTPGTRASLQCANWRSPPLHQFALTQATTRPTAPTSATARTRAPAATGTPVTARPAPTLTNALLQHTTAMLKPYATTPKAHSRARATWATTMPSVSPSALPTTSPTPCTSTRPVRSSRPTARSAQAPLLPTSPTQRPRTTLTLAPQTSATATASSHGSSSTT